LRYQIFLVVIIATLLSGGFYAAFRKALRELRAGDTGAGLAYLLFSVAGVFSLFLGSVVGITGLIEKAYGY
jgi:hypothetical protein